MQCADTNHLATPARTIGTLLTAFYCMFPIYGSFMDIIPTLKVDILVHTLEMRKLRPTDDVTLLGSQFGKWQILAFSLYTYFSLGP